ncbi:MAG: alpha/beta fold hydrolase [Gemmataceae bacterium]
MAEAETGVCDTGRYQCAYVCWGKGPPLLFIPGLHGAANSFTLLMAHLVAHFQCIAYDLPMGQDDGAVLSTYRHADFAADALALLDHLGIERSYVFATSFGGTIALRALQAAPQRLPRAILQAGFAHRPLAPAEVLLARMSRRWRRPLGTLPFFADFLSRVHYPPFADKPPEVWQAFVAHCGAPLIAAIAHRALLLHRFDMRPALPAIRQPILLVGGDSDPLVRWRHEGELARGLPHARRVQLTNCGHYPRFTHPDALAQVIQQFLTPQPAAGSGE